MSMTVRKGAAAVSSAMFALVFAACTGSAGGGGGGTPDGGGTPVEVDCGSLSGTESAQIGGGIDTTGFVDLNNGAEMVGYVGPQGLFMVTPSLCIQNMWPGEKGRAGHNPEDPEVLFETFLASDDTKIGGSARENLGLTPQTGCHELLAVFVPFFDSVDINTYLNQQVELQVTVKDACDRRAMDTLTIVVKQ